MTANMIRHDIRLPEWADARIKQMSVQKGIMQATLLRSIVLEHIGESPKVGE
jgi:predicted DNA-binding protein